MNRRQNVTVVVGVLDIAGLALFPPWIHHHTDADKHVNIPKGFHWVFGTRDLDWGLRVDRGCLHDFQGAALALAVAAVPVLGVKGNP